MTTVLPVNNGLYLGISAAALGYAGYTLLSVSQKQRVSTRSQSTAEWYDSPGAAPDPYLAGRGGDTSDVGAAAAPDLSEVPAPATLQSGADGEFTDGNWNSETISTQSAQRHTLLQDMQIQVRDDVHNGQIGNSVLSLTTAGFASDIAASGSTVLDSTSTHNLQTLTGPENSRLSASVLQSGHDAGGSVHDFATATQQSIASTLQTDCAQAVQSGGQMAQIGCDTNNIAAGLAAGTVGFGIDMAGSVVDVGTSVVGGAIASGELLHTATTTPQTIVNNARRVETEHPESSLAHQTMAVDAFTHGNYSGAATQQVQAVTSGVSEAWNSVLPPVPCVFWCD